MMGDINYQSDTHHAPEYSKWELTTTARRADERNKKADKKTTAQRISPSERQDTKIHDRHRAIITPPPRRDEFAVAASCPPRAHSNIKPCAL